MMEALGLTEGGGIRIEAADPRGLRVARDLRRQEALEARRQFGWSLPPGFHFDRQAAKSRGAGAAPSSTPAPCSMPASAGPCSAGRGSCGRWPPPAPCSRCHGH
ncbi:hypothetical protein E2C05_16925 [Paracraurococcus ruber]|nr:hypothetical protein E2C05_16925 [Paracraurococcus ruber]